MIILNWILEKYDGVIKYDSIQVAQARD
jgi:hypothetical protein